MNLKFGEYLKNMGLKLLLRNIHFCEQMVPCLIMLTILWVVLELHLQIYCFVIAVVRLFVLDP